MGRKRRKIKAHEKRIKYYYKGKLRIGIQKRKFNIRRGKYVRGKRECLERSRRMKGRIGQWYRIGDRDELLQMWEVGRIKAEVMKELGLV